jgi:hypothetical protein
MSTDAALDLEHLGAALQAPRYLSPVSAWVEHIPFAFAAVSLLRPRTVVELGTHMGDSYCAFCQAIETLGIEARLTAIDTWQGDSQAGGYGQGILDGLRAYHDPLYGRFSRLLQDTFDDAVGQFADASVDLLHIDGLHTYEAVQHDFETWLPKVSARGLVLFHDTQVRRGDFGVYRLWEELAGQYPSFEFTHGYGLGVLAVGNDLPAEMAAFLGAARRTPTLVRQYFSVLGNRIQLARGLSRLSDVERASQDALAELIAPFESVPTPAAVPEPMSTIDLLDGTRYDLKQWIDGRCETASARSAIIAHLREHVRWLHGKSDTLAAEIGRLGGHIGTLEQRIEALTARPAPANLAVYTSDADGFYSDSRVQTVQVLPDGAAANIRVRIEMPGGGPARRVRLDPGDRPAFWWIRGPRLEFVSPALATASIEPGQVVAGAGARLLDPPANLDTPGGGDYVLFCHTGDPQLELRIGGILPQGPVVFDLALECRLLDSFQAYRGAPAGAVDAHVADLLAATLAKPTASDERTE